MQKGLKFRAQSVEVVPQEGQMRHFIYIGINTQWETADLASYPGARLISEMTDNHLMLKTALGMATRGDVFVVQRFSDLGATLKDRKELIDLAAAMGVQVISSKSKQTISNYDDYMLLLEDVAEAPKERKVKLTKEDMEKVKQMVAEDRSQRYIAKKLGVSHPTIARALAPKRSPKKSHKLPDHSEE